MYDKRTMGQGFLSPVIGEGASLGHFLVNVCYVHVINCNKEPNMTDSGEGYVRLVNHTLAQREVCMG